MSDLIKKVFGVSMLLTAVVFAGCTAQNQGSAEVPAQEEEMESKALETEAPEAEPVVETPAAPVAAPKVQAPAKSSNGSFKPFPVYTDSKSPDNHYVASGWMGDYNDIRYDETNLTNPQSGGTCIKVTYSPKASQGARWAGIYWQNPPNNWGTRPGGYDLTGAKRVTFWARGEKGGERIEEFKIGGITGEYADSDIAGIGPVVLTPEWKQYTIELEGKDLSSISGGFCWSTNLDVNPEGATFYIDTIRYE